MADKITMTFTGYDDNDDGFVSFEGPIAISAQVDTVDDLLTLDVSGWDKADPLVVFVKNVNADIGKIPYRGSFFRYDFDKSSWQQIVLGSHSHNNMDLLNQLGEIDIDGMKPGDRKILTIEATTINSYNARVAQSTDNKTYIQWCRDNEDQTVDDNWHNLLKCSNIYTRNPFRAETATTKLVYLLKDYVMDENNVTTIYTKYAYIASDEMDVIGTDGNRVIWDDNNEIYVEDGILYFKYADGTYLMLDIASEARIYKNRVQWKWKYNNFWTDVASISEIIQQDTGTEARYSQFGYTFSYCDISELQNNANANSDTESEIDSNKYALKSHTHSQYIKWSDVDAFDYRYADYNHTHGEYITKAQVVALISDILVEDETGGSTRFDRTSDETRNLSKTYYEVINDLDSGREYYLIKGIAYSPVVFPDDRTTYNVSNYYERKTIVDDLYDKDNHTLTGVLSTLAEEIVNQTKEELRDETLSKDQIYAYIKHLYSEHNDTDEIDIPANTDGLVTTFTGGTLTDYLIYLTNKTNTVEQLESSKIMTSVEIPVIKNVGGYKSGDVINKGTSVETIIETLLSPDEAPELLYPTLTADITASTYEIGKNTTLTINPIYTQNNAGVAIIKIYIIRGDSQTVINYDGEPVNFIISPLKPLDKNGLFAKIRIVADYGDGYPVYVGNDETRPYYIHGSFLVYEKELYASRLPYIGSSTFTLDNVTGANIYTLVNSYINNLLFEVDPEKELNTGYRLTLKPETKSKSIIVAVPEASKYDIAKVIFENQGFDLLEDCDVYKNIIIPDANNEVSSVYNYDYTVYVYNLTQTIQNEVNLTYMFTKKQEG